MADEEGGGVQRLVPAVPSMPWPQQMARSMSPAAVRELSEQVGRRVSALGVDVDLAPVLDLDGAAVLSASDPDGPRSFGTDPAQVAAYGTAFVAGMRQAGVLAVVKHFPGLGGSTGNTDYGPASTRPWAELESGGLLPFANLFRGGAAAVMVANASVPGLSAGPASLSSAVVTAELRGRVGFRGLMLTDSLSAGAIRAAGYSVPAAAAAAAVAALAAGDDMVLFGSTLIPADTAALSPGALQASIESIEEAVVRAVSDGELPLSRLDEAVADVLSAKGFDPCRAGR